MRLKATFRRCSSAEDAENVTGRSERHDHPEQLNKIQRLGGWKHDELGSVNLYINRSMADALDESRGRYFLAHIVYRGRDVDAVVHRAKDMTGDTTNPEEAVIEVFSAQRLRETLGLSEGDSISIELHV